MRWSVRRRVGNMFLITALRKGDDAVDVCWDVESVRDRPRID